MQRSIILCLPRVTTLHILELKTDLNDQSMKKVYGIMVFLLFVVVATALMSEAFLSSYNLENLVRRTALFGIISVGVSFVIISGGIDLSIGSVICLIG